MKKTKVIIALVAGHLALFLYLSLSTTEAESSPDRIVSLDASSTETLFALGMGDNVVGRDSASTYPDEANRVPVLGDMFSFNPEAVLAGKPTLIVANPNRMRPQTVEQFKGAGVDILLVPGEPTAEGAIAKIRKIAKKVDRVDEGEAIVAAIEKDLETLAEKISARGDKPPIRVLGTMAMGNQVLALGVDSQVVGMARLAGAETALPEIERYSPINAEAVIAASPEAVLVGTESEALKDWGNRLSEMPGVALTPAGQTNRIVAMEALFLSGFGPRTGQAALDLFHGLYEIDGPYLSEAK